VIRVVVADDSATSRQLLRAVLEDEGDIIVVAEAHDGAEAIELVTQHRPDIVVMDVHMPVLDGLAATKEIMLRAPVPILIVSAVRQRDVDLSLSATQAGALMALAKPESPASPTFRESSEELRAMTRAMSQVKVVRRWSGASAPSIPASPRLLKDVPEIVAIATSTGGPPALRRILMDLPRNFPVPIFVVQHIARGFTAGFAEWLSNGCSLTVKLAAEGEKTAGGTVYVAPDSVHLGVGTDRRIRLSVAPAIGGFRPSGNHLFESASAVYGARMVAVILTGMGVDGADGLDIARKAGAFVLAQDEATSIVYGMAGEAVKRGSVDLSLPLEKIAARLTQLVVRSDSPYG